MITVKTVGIAGLGLIGGSFAKAYKENSDVKVLGVDLNNSITHLATVEGAIDGVLTKDNIGECDLIIPALYPVYKRMKIDPKILLCLTGACMGVMNLLPWGGPTARAATVLEMDANELWHMLIPVQIMGLICNIILAVFLGMLAIKQGAGSGKGEEIDVDEKAASEADALRKHGPMLIFDLLLTVGVITVLSMGLAQSYVVFMVALCILLAVNYPNQKLQDKLF